MARQPRNGTGPGLATRGRHEITATATAGQQGTPLRTMVAQGAGVSREPGTWRVTP